MMFREKKKRIFNFLNHLKSDKNFQSPLTGVGKFLTQKKKRKIYCCPLWWSENFWQTNLKFENFTCSIYNEEMTWSQGEDVKLKT